MPGLNFVAKVRNECQAHRNSHYRNRMVPEHYDAEADAVISNLVQRSQELSRAAEVQNAVLEESEGWARKGPVEITLAPEGSVRKIIFAEEPDKVGIAALTNFTMQAIREASERANRATASAVIDPGARAAVLESLPADIAEQREPGDTVVDGPDEPVEQGSFTVDDLPPDPEFDRLLDEIFDADDPLETLHAKAAAGEVSSLPEVRPGEDLDEAIRRDIAATAERVTQAGEQLRTVQATVQNDELSATVGAWGNVVHLEFRTGATRRKPEELAADVMRTLQEATAQAEVEVRSLLAGTSVADFDVRTITMMGEQR